MKREEAKDLFRKDKDSYGKPKAIMSKIDKIYDDFDAQETWTDDNMIDFANWFRMWYSHPKVGIHAFDALRRWKEIKKQK